MKLLDRLIKMHVLAYGGFVRTLWTCTYSDFCVLGPRYLAEWMTYGYPTANVWPLDIKRFGNLQSSRTFLRHRVMEVVRE